MFQPVPLTRLIPWGGLGSLFIVAGLGGVVNKSMRPQGEGVCFLEIAMSSVNFSLSYSSSLDLLGFVPWAAERNKKKISE